MTSKAEVYIIESLDLGDEDHRKEGEILSRTLKLAGKEPIYRYIRTKSELEYFIQDFEKTNYRYLHISCHGNNNLIGLTLDNLNNDEFSRIVGPILGGKRLFLSSCLATTDDLAQKVFQHGDCRTVAGPKNSIAFDDSTIFWTSFYHLMFKKEANGMANRDIMENIMVFGWALSEQFRFYRRTKQDGMILPTDKMLKSKLLSI